MNTNELTCPVCGNAHSADVCPECGFPVLRFLTPPTAALQAAEEQRIRAAKRIWDELCEMKENQKKRQEETEELKKKVNSLMTANSALEERLSVPVAAPPEAAGYLVQMRGKGEVLGVYAVYPGLTMVGTSPQQTEGRHRCRIVDSEPDFQREHFTIDLNEDGTAEAVLVPGNTWSINYRGNRMDRCTLDNGTRIFIGGMELVYVSR